MPITSFLFDYGYNDDKRREKEIIFMRSLTMTNDESIVILKLL